MIRNSLSNNIFSHHRSNNKNNSDLEKNMQLEFLSKYIVTKSITFNELVISGLKNYLRIG
jgi:hypothetical protein